MKKTIYILIALLLLFVLLLCVDLLTGIWYWNNLNLKFDSGEFNNILTPLLTLIATPIYAFALYTTIKQNKIALSQNIKPFYEKEIDNLVLKAKNIKFKNFPGFEKKKINALNYVKHISDCFLTFSLNEQYRQDYESYENGEKFTKDYFFSRSYINEIMFISNFSIGIGETFFLHADIKSLINKIDSSKLIQEDKNLLKSRIYGELLAEYMEFVKLDRKHNFTPKFPDIYQGMKSKEIEFKKISETGFGSSYEWIRNEYKAST